MRRPEQKGRHGVQARAVSEVTETNIADALLSRISDLSADLLVMGAMVIRACANGSWAV